MNATTTRRELRIGILGAGIMGASLALLLARKGVRVAMFDEAPAPFSGASRWNEGKIHLGYVYAADPSLGTAMKLLPASLKFRPLVEQLVGRSIVKAVACSDDIFLVHEQSVVDADRMAGYFDAVSQLIRAHPDATRYLTDVSNAGVVRFSQGELERISGSKKIVAGFRVPERSVATRWIADLFVDALAAEPRIETVPNARIVGVRGDAAWTVMTTERAHGPFDMLVNALWHGRADIDKAAGLVPGGRPVSYRYRASLFVTTKRAWELPSALIATGPFGDVKNYDGRSFYFSWYPAGLLVDSTEPRIFDIARQADEVKQRIAAETIAALQEYFPETRLIADSATETIVQGGWVVADGKGDLSDPASLLHKRDRFGVTRMGTYVTIDTGKYSAAPWLAHRLADELAG